MTGAFLKPASMDLAERHKSNAPAYTITAASVVTGHRDLIGVSLRNSNSY
ncbi:MAG: hypothetical protein WCE45_09845 [Sedimentisphaerales bacterium]